MKRAVERATLRRATRREALEKGLATLLVEVGAKRASSQMRRRTPGGRESIRVVWEQVKRQLAHARENFPSLGSLVNDSDPTRKRVRGALAEGWFWTCWSIAPSSKKRQSPPPDQRDLNKFLGQAQKPRQKTLTSLFTKNQQPAMAPENDEMDVDEAQSKSPA